MKIAIIGAGAMGSLYASYLSVKNEVILLDTYDKQVEKINIDGITLIENDNSEKVYYPKAVMSGTDVGNVDLVIVFVKSTYTFDAVKMNQKLIGDKTIVMTLQNGAGNNRDISNFIAEDRIIVGTTSHNCVSKGLGKIYHSGVGPSNIGPNIPGDKINEELILVKNTFDESGLDVNILDDIQKVLWNKIFVNCGINGLSMVMDCKIGEMIKNDQLLDLLKHIVYECVMVAEADGSFFERKEALDNVITVAKSNETGVASMCQDRHNKRITEIDKINGVIVKLGQEYNVDTPYNRMLVKMVHAVENTYSSK
mgnify:CR=1 FL=1